MWQTRPPAARYAYLKFPRPRRVYLACVALFSGSPTQSTGRFSYCGCFSSRTSSLQACSSIAFSMSAWLGLGDDSQLELITIKVVCSISTKLPVVPVPTRRIRVSVDAACKVGYSLISTSILTPTNSPGSCSALASHLGSPSSAPNKYAIASSTPLQAAPRLQS